MGLRRRYWQTSEPSPWLRIRLHLPITNSTRAMLLALNDPPSRGIYQERAGVHASFHCWPSLICPPSSSTSERFGDEGKEREGDRGHGELLVARFVLPPLQSLTVHEHLGYICRVSIVEHSHASAILGSPTVEKPRRQLLYIADVSRPQGIHESIRHPVEKNKRLSDETRVSEGIPTMIQTSC